MPVSSRSTAVAVLVISAVTHSPLASAISALPTTRCQISLCTAARATRERAITTTPVPTTAREPKRRSPIPPSGPASVAAIAPGSRKKPISVALAPNP